MNPLHLVDAIGTREYVEKVADIWTDL
jgi:hypothetical protein